MNVFTIHKNIIDDYSSYIESFINIKDADISDKVKLEIKEGKLWPKPLIQFNPGFEVYGDIDKFIEKGILAPELKYIFKNYKLYSHQAQAIEIGSSGKDFIVTSGTGSGKSLTYLATIFNDLILHKSEKKGIRAIIVYPMNALINSQFKEIGKYAQNYVAETEIGRASCRERV